MQIYVAEGTQQTGPFDLDTIKAGLHSGKYQPSQLAWYEGAPGWEPIGKLPGMEVPAAPPPPPVPAAPPPPYSPAPAPAPGAYSPPPAPYSPAPPPSPYPSAPGAYSPPYVPPTSTAPYGSAGAPERKGFWAKVGAGLATAAVVLFFILKIFVLGSRSRHLFDSSSSSSSTPSHSASSASSASTPTPPPAPTTIRTTPYYNNANQFLAGELHQHHVNFRFNYPSDFSMVSGSRVAHKDDFVEVDHLERSQSVETLYVEDYYCGAGATLASVLPTLAAKYFADVAANAKKDNPTTQVVSQGMTKFNGYAAYEYRSQWSYKNKDGQTFQLYNRYVIVAPPTGSNGVILEIYAADNTPGVRSVNDVGRTPGMATILNSFAFL